MCEKLIHSIDWTVEPRVIRFVAPNIAFGELNWKNVRFAKNVTHFVALSKGTQNFGHQLHENMASVYPAMESFDILSASG
jgi:hypothetical protein